jgi:UDP-glucuronate 4-epimerase
VHCLVTGGAGFIGSHLTAALLRDGHRVTVIDGFTDPPRQRRNLAEIPPAFTLVEADIRSLAALPSPLPDIVFHLAALPGVRRSVEAPLEYAEVNTLGTVRLLDAVRRAGVPRFVFASSSSVYGAGAPLPFSEDYSTTCPLSPYAASKLAAEAYCQSFARGHGLAVTCFRLFTVYGPRQRPDLAIARFLRAAATGEPVPFYGDGTSSRDYTFVDDAVAGLLAAVPFDFGFRIFNLAAGQPVSLNNLLAAVTRVTGRSPVLQPLPAHPADADATLADITKARQILGFQPSVSFEHGLRRQWRWALASGAIPTPD